MTDPEILEQRPAAAEPRSDRRRGRRTAMAVAAAAVVLIGGGVAVAANTASGPSGGTPAAAPSSSAPDAPHENWPHRFHHQFGGMPFLGGYGAPLHGTFVVPKSGGGYTTITMQRGTATAVTKTTVTVRSADGWTKSYTVPAGALVNAARDGLTSIKKGHEVVVLASGTGARLTATRVLDVSLGRSQWRARDLPLRPNSGPNGDSNGAPTAPSGSDT